MQKMNEKYLCLCNKFRVPVRISTTNDPEAPKQQICDDNGVTVIMLNTNKIAEDDYEICLAYNVRKTILPRLVLETERLIIRRFQLADAVDCFAFLSVAEDCYMDCCKPFKEMDEEYNRYMQVLQDRDTQHMIVLKEENKVIGTVNVFSDDSRAVETMEIGYSIGSVYQRNGYAYEALTALVNLLQNELYIELIVAGVLEENIASIKLLEKMGFNKEGRRRKAVWHEGLDRPIDLVYYYRDR